MPTDAISDFGQLRYRGRSLLACAICGATAFFSMMNEASASPDLLLNGDQIALSGTHHYRILRLTNGSRISVTPYDGTPGTGELEIIAHRVLIDGTSTIQANGCGYRGLQNKEGEGPGGGKGAAQTSDATGGGAYGGNGGPGVMLSGCTAIQLATGGSSYDTASASVTMGSAGSAAGSADGDDGGRGGDGGGKIVLRASQVELDGTIEANGKSGAVYNGDSAGGGAGGGILLEASSFSSFPGLLSVNGGAGGRSTKDEGGAGGGGRIRLIVPSVPLNLQMSIAGGVGQCASTKGGIGTTNQIAPASSCVDLDCDGFSSNQCGGTDCDDSDATTHPGAVEQCDGVDNDCSNSVDDGNANAGCASGTCSAGACVGADASADVQSDAVVDGDAGEGNDADATEAQVDAAKDVGWESGEDAAIEASGDAGVDGLGQQDGETGKQEAADLVLRGGCSSKSRQGNTNHVWELWIGLLVFGAIRLRRCA